MLNRGRVEQVGTPRELYDEPANVFVAEFIGESNLLLGRVLEVRDHLATVEGNGGLRFLAVHRGEVNPGASIAAMVRPEQVSLRARGHTSGVPNRWPCRISEVTYSGSTMRYRVVCAPMGGSGASQLLLAAVRRGDGEGGLEVGDEVEAVWDPRHTRLLDDA